MADAGDSTEMLLQKARERRAKHAESALLQREKTGAEKLGKNIFIKQLINYIGWVCGVVCMF